jgi:hypothetical protein
MIGTILKIIGVIYLILTAYFAICVYKIWRYSEIGAIDLDDIGDVLILQQMECVRIVVKGCVASLQVLHIAIGVGGNCHETR